MRWRCLFLAAIIASGGCERAADQGVSTRQADERPGLGFMTSLPIYWGEPAEITELLNGQADQHWMREVLEHDYRIVPLDSLGAADGQPNADFATLDRLMVAQPRALTAADNVALDNWVRGGGRLLLVLDPMMTEHSAYQIGDKRRFNDVALVPPLLKRWGLELRHAEEKLAHEVLFNGAALPVEEHGIFSTLPPAAQDVDCALAASGIVADCRIGEGHAVIIADAAFLNREGDNVNGRGAAYAVLNAAFN